MKRIKYWNGIPTYIPFFCIIYIRCYDRHQSPQVTPGTLHRGSIFPPDDMMYWQPNIIVYLKKLRKRRKRVYTKWDLRWNKTIVDTVWRRRRKKNKQISNRGNFRLWTERVILGYRSCQRPCTKLLTYLPRHTFILMYLFSYFLTRLQDTDHIVDAYPG